MINQLIKIFKKDKIGEPPWDYYFLQNLPESEYPKYLAKLFYLNTGEKLPLSKKLRIENASVLRNLDFVKTGSLQMRELKINYETDKKRCKTFNQKLQWIKLYGITDLMRDCTDKVKVRDYVKEKIGEEYLKPVLQIIPNNTSVIANHNSILGGEAIRRNLRKSETRVNEGIDCDREKFAECEGVFFAETSSGKEKPKSRLTQIFQKSDNEVCDLPERQQIQRQEKVKHATGNENSGIKPEFQTVDCHGTQNVVVPRNDGEPDDVSTYFDQIEFDKLPDSFVIKTNHGCKWQYIIKNKEEFLKNKRLFELIKRQMTGWLSQDYSFWGGFEMQYQEKGIEPKILIEPLLRDNTDKEPVKINVWCFCGKPEITYVFYGNNKQSVYDKNFNCREDLFNADEINIFQSADNLIKQACKLSEKLSVNFKFVRVDWMIYQNKLYFEELTFTPYSGFRIFKNKENDIRLGAMINEL